MAGFRKLFVVLLAVLAACVVARAQDVKIIPPRPTLDELAPLGLEGKAPLKLEIRSESQVSEQDRNLEADAESTIRERATLQALDLNSGQWSWSELACPVFPGHLLLRFTRNNGEGDVSAFAVSIPRFGQGRVRFVPLIRRGYSLWSPAPINAMTMAALNHILAEEKPVKPDWSGMAVCYAALAGAAGPDAQALTLNRPPLLNLGLDGQATVSFVTGTSHPREWRMIFDRKGVLKKATHKPSSELEVLNPKPALLTGYPVQPSRDIPPPGSPQ
jgi:hypothetical protein